VKKPSKEDKMEEAGLLQRDLPAGVFQKVCFKEFFETCLSQLLRFAYANIE